MIDNKNYMAKSIKDLPVYTAPEDVWKQMESKTALDRGRIHLNQALDDMRVQMKAPSHIWENLQKELDLLKTKASLTKAIKSLPQYPAPLVFNDLNKNEDKSPIWMNDTFRWVSGIAATLLLFFSIYYSPDPNEHITWTASVEEMPSSKIIEMTVDQFNKDDELLSLIETHCNRLIVLCEAPEFKGLYEYYLELGASKKELLAEMANSKQIHMIDYLIRVEKEKNEVGKKLLQMIIG